LLLNRGASAHHYRQSSLWSCRSAISVCSCGLATPMDSRYESSLDSWNIT
jgi:hypothetical protein